MPNDRETLQSTLLQGLTQSETRFLEPAAILVGIKSLLMLFGITTVLIDVNAALSKLVLLENFNENYSKCLRLLDKYVAEILKKFDFASVKTSYSNETMKPLVKMRKLLMWYVLAALVKGRQDGLLYNLYGMFCEEKNLDNVEQLWTLLVRTVNNISYIDAIVAGKPVTISEASIRSDLLFDDADGIDTLNNQAIFDTIQLMGTSSSIPIPDSNPERSGGNHGGQSSSDRSLSGNEDGLTLQTLKKKAIPVINHHKAWFRAARFKKQQKKKDMEKSKKRRVYPNRGGNLSNLLKTDSMVEEPKTSFKTEELHLSGDTLVVEDKGSAEKGGSTKSTDLQQSTIKPDESTVKPDEGTDKQNEGTDRQVEGTAENKDQDSRENANPTALTTTSTPTPIVFGDDETIAQVLLASDEEMARKVQEEWEGEEERNRLAEEKATNEALIRNYDDIKARIEADRLLAEKLQEEEREKFTIEEREKFLHDTIAAQRKFLTQQRSEAIRNRPPIKNQVRNQMMAYLKHVGNFKHSELKTKKFEEIQALYEKIKRSDEDFISIGSAEDERLIKKMNEKGIDSSKNEMVKEESKEEESTRKRKLGTRKKMKSRKRRFIQNISEDDSEKENDQLRLCLTIAPDEDKEVDYEILDKKYPIIKWKTECLGTKPQVDKAKHLEEINQNVVIRSNGQKRYFSTLMRVLSIFDRDELNAVYQLVMNKYQDEIPEGFDRVLWGDLMTMFNPDDKDKFWNSQQDWNVRKKYPLRKIVLLQMLELKLESEEDITMALELIKFVKKLVAKLEPEDSDGDEEDL
ncbi:hypothetical protein Tco_1466525 [Tanacetum coccineum]